MSKTNANTGDATRTYRLPVKLIEQMQKVAGYGQMNSFVVEAIKEKLEREGK